MGLEYRRCQDCGEIYTLDQSIRPCTIQGHKVIRWDVDCALPVTTDDVETVAGRLGTSPMDLMGRLKRYGLNFAKLSDQVPHDLAMTVEHDLAAGAR